MRRIASPVVIVTVETPEGPRGATIGSFTSVSLEPPLVSFNVTRETQLHQALNHADRFAVHLLAAEHADLATHFALPDLSSAAQFDSVEHARFADGRAPHVAGTLGILLCRTESRFAAGDHSIFVGRVNGVEVGLDGTPLLYYARSYRDVGEEV
ncbi:MAG: flavin reductase [Rhodothermaceae bacterium]|nr:flavin reductase [Rhodothermaceae bacterium]